MRLQSGPTPYAEVNCVLRDLRARVQEVLGARFVGLYLYGSLASGDFDPQRSDIDFVVVTTSTLTPEAIAALETLHADLWASGLKWASKLEGAYIPLAALAHYDRAAGPFPQVNEGRFFVERHGSDWIIQRHILRERGVTVAGPPIRPLIAPVSVDDLRRAVRGVLREWWAPMLADPARLSRPDYQAFAILTMCRALYALEWGEIVPKTAAAQWAGEMLGEPWSALIADARQWQTGQTFAHAPETVELIRLTLARANEVDER